MDQVCVIAEAGVNHNGNPKLAKEMIDAAKEAGADYIKFQTFIPENLVSRYAEKAEYQKETTDADETQLQMLQKLTLKCEDFLKLKKYCDESGIGFLSTPFDLDSIDFLEKSGCALWKIPSGEITNLPYLEKIAKTHKPIILSTGMSEIDEIRECFELLKKHGTEDITLLHCTTQYPTPFIDVNLNAMLTLKKQFGCKVGYSDHTSGIEVPIAAVAMGASVIEKHFTLDRTMEGPDHKASLEPDELKKMVESVRNIEKALGSTVKKTVPSEAKNREVVRKSIVAAKNIDMGEMLTEENLTTKRPGYGISPMRWHEVIGTNAIRSFEEDELIEM